MSLTAEQVETVTRLYCEEQWGSHRIARELGVANSTVWRIITKAHLMRTPEQARAILHTSRLPNAPATRQTPRKKNVKLSRKEIRAIGPLSQQLEANADEVNESLAAASRKGRQGRNVTLSTEAEREANLRNAAIQQGLALARSGGVSHLVEVVKSALSMLSEDDRLDVVAALETSIYGEH